MPPDRLFHGDLVRLAAPRPEDAAVLSRWSEDGEYRRLADTDAPRPLPTEFFGERDQVAEASPTAFEFRIRTIADDRLVGFVAVFSIEWTNGHGWIAAGIGDARDRGKGFGKEALSLTLRFAFHELGLRRVALDVIATNEAAIGLYRNLGFLEEGRMRERVLRDGRSSDLIYMGLLRRNWEARLPRPPAMGA
ncbi:MAG TPA: GNAT family protein [Candidatus Dormibacteraeota bacterium]